MRLELTARHFAITAPMRKLAEQRLARVLRPLNDIALSAQVVITKEKSRFHAEVTLHARGEHFLHGEATGRDPQTAIGASIAWLAFNDLSVSTMTGTSPSQLTFTLDVNGSLILAGALIALGIGLLGGLLPALRAGNVPVASAMRAL